MPTATNTLSFAAVALKGKDTNATKPKTPARRRKITAKQMEVIHRRFVPVTSRPDYDCKNSRSTTPVSWMYTIPIDKL
ncbi:hypothetical protein G6F55_014029 [Rhizopus delemar]|uniref:Uncharacterized protein n=2 Tax=Rhizopus TaxID=4842 RepID=A0A9P6XRC0_9FUNG|nr:hypothetical protein G6F55_014029 [Rhizopus delemar]KAG1528454.1 hypothetical protein G6F51_014257 [Rhizopus arrhizus]KAG1530988.1 hypothetical protein G6F50_016962 [Rhizopus delemar]KAG1531936.1 hypothetical protein G6F49_013759 [Rhizopus delemar]KAG1606927.1 hypothetical protein G6F45_013877 [Rhizopus arrhizus]